MNLNQPKQQPAASTRSSGSASTSKSKETPEERRGKDRRNPFRQDTRAQRIFFRGTNLLPTGEKVQACIAGTKQSILVDILSRPEGATMEELIEALSGGRRPWTEATVRSGFGWDLKNKGYGVRSEFDIEGVERFHLILPPRQKIPPHVTPAEARKRAAKKK